MSWAELINSILKTLEICYLVVYQRRECANKLATAVKTPLINVFTVWTALKPKAWTLKYEMKKKEHLRVVWKISIIGKCLKNEQPSSTWFSLAVCIFTWDYRQKVTPFVPFIAIMRTVTLFNESYNVVHTLHSCCLFLFFFFFLLQCWQILETDLK